MRGLTDAIAVICSLCLQYGVPVETLSRKFAQTRFEPSGHTRNPDIPEASSIADYIFRWIGLTFGEQATQDLTKESLPARKTHSGNDCDRDQAQAESSNE